MSDRGMSVVIAVALGTCLLSKQYIILTEIIQIFEVSSYIVVCMPCSDAILGCVCTSALNNNN